jgi:hypothetical protein
VVGFGQQIEQALARVHGVRRRRVDGGVTLDTDHAHAERLEQPRALTTEWTVSDY